MIIQQSHIGMTAQHQAMQRRQESERLQRWTGPRPQPAEDNQGGERVSLSSRGQAMAQRAQAAHEARQAQRVRGNDDKNEDQLDPKLMLIKQAIESLTGQEIKLVNLQDFSLDAQHSISAEEFQSQQTNAGGLDYQYHASYTETESLDFSASGTVKTADGRELEFSLDISLERSFSMETEQRIQLGNAVQSKDPLVINVDAPAARLTDQKFDFDVDSDGKAEKVSMLQPGSGFLALDNNDDGKVNNGNELFGTKSGNGFADLAKFDQDGNNWIDQADAIFKKLKIWLKDAAGKDSLIDLSHAKIGAIFLGNTKTDFKHADADNHTNGNLRSSGVYLKDDGKAGSVQQIDLAV